jgi:DNA processing protein
MEYEDIADWREKPELKKLLDLSDPPKSLYARGAWDPSIFSECVAVVGSRKITSYGRQVIDSVVPKLVLDGKTIVSGFMYGVDQYAHEVCIENGGRTIAVLGWGIDIPLEDTDKKLAQKIIDSGGVLISEWISQKGALWTFPVRNRIVAALSADVIVVEAAIKSGSLLTARLATKLKRNLYAVPGPLTSKTSAGTNMLIATGEAKMWLGSSSSAPSKSQSDPILKILENESLTTNEIARFLGKSIGEVGAQLSLFAITGQVVERDGKYFLHDEM